MITLTREEAQQVLDALVDAAWCVQHNNLPPDDGNDWDKEIELLRARLAQPEPEYKSYQCQQCGEVIGWLGRVMPFHKCAQPEPEPVADKYLMEIECTKCGAKQDGVLTVTTPQQRNWQRLTEQDFSAINQSCSTKLQAATSAESILKEKNT